MFYGLGPRLARTRPEPVSVADHPLAKFMTSTTLPVTMTALIQSAPVTIKGLHKGRDAATPATPTFTRRDVRQHHDETSCWIIVEDKVYDVTQFLHVHPGGCEIMLEYAGGDATGAFWDKGHSGHAIRMLHQYCIGHLAQNPAVG